MIKIIRLKEHTFVTHNKHTQIKSNKSHLIFKYIGIVGCFLSGIANTQWRRILRSRQGKTSGFNLIFPVSFLPIVFYLYIFLTTLHTVLYPTSNAMNKYYEIYLFLLLNR